MVGKSTIAPTFYISCLLSVLCTKFQSKYYNQEGCYKQNKVLLVLGVLDDSLALAVSLTGLEGLGQSRIVSLADHASKSVVGVEPP